MVMETKRVMSMTTKRAMVSDDNDNNHRNNNDRDNNDDQDDNSNKDNNDNDNTENDNKVNDNDNNQDDGNDNEDEDSTATAAGGFVGNGGIGGDNCGGVGGGSFGRWKVVAVMGLAVVDGGGGAHGSIGGAGVDGMALARGGPSRGHGGHDKECFCGVREFAKFCSPFSPVPLNLCQQRNPMGTISVVPEVGQEVFSTSLGTNWYCSTFGLWNTFCTKSWKIFLRSQQFCLLFQES
jgi:hypothetical protein